MALRRKFIAHLSTGDVKIPDPGAQFSPDDVRKMAAADHPELTNAAIVYHDPKEGVQEYGFNSKSKTAATVKESSGKEPSKASGGQTIGMQPSIGRKG